jgi:hypothetical protein
VFANPSTPSSEPSSVSEKVLPSKTALRPAEAQEEE